MLKLLTLKSAADKTVLALQQLVMLQAADRAEQDGNCKGTLKGVSTGYQRPCQASCLIAQPFHSSCLHWCSQSGNSMLNSCLAWNLDTVFHHLPSRAQWKVLPGKSPVNQWSCTLACSCGTTCFNSSVSPSMWGAGEGFYQFLVGLCLSSGFQSASTMAGGAGAGDC